MQSPLSQTAPQKLRDLQRNYLLKQFQEYFDDVAPEKKYALDLNEPPNRACRAERLHAFSAADFFESSHHRRFQTR